MQMRPLFFRSVDRALDATPATSSDIVPSSPGTMRSARCWRPPSAIARPLIARMTVPHFPELFE